MGQVRLHLATCTQCSTELALWQSFTEAADEERRALSVGAESLDAALVSLWRSVAEFEAAGAEFIPEADLEPLATDLLAVGRPVRAPAPSVVPVARLSPRGQVFQVAAVAAAAVLFVIVPVVMMLTPSSSGGGARGQVAQSPPIAPSEAEIQDRDLTEMVAWQLDARAEALRARLGKLSIIVAVGGRLRKSDGVPPRITLDRGRADFSNDSGEPVIVRIGDIDLIVESHSVVSAAIDETGENGERRTSVGVWDGRAYVKGVGPTLDQILEGGVALSDGDGVLIDSGPEGSSLAQQGGALDLGLEPSALPPIAEPGIAVTSTESPDPAPAPVPEDPGDGAPTVELPDSEDDTQTTVSRPVRELADGTVQVTLPEASYAVGDVVRIEVLCGAGENGLGAYQLEIDFQPRDSDLVVSIESAPLRQGAISGAPLLSPFDSETQVLQVADTMRGAPLGRGTFTMLSFDVRIIAGSPGRHAVGGTVQQMIDPDRETIGVPAMQVMNSITIRQ